MDRLVKRPDEPTPCSPRGPRPGCPGSEGTGYEDDDSVLYLIDDRGELIAKDDDSGEGYASRLEVDLPYAGRYFAAVTTYGDDVELDDRDHLVGFDDDGGSHFEFQLVVDTE